ncbi:HlyD family secretion protein [Pedobacter westerhofensis]|uniref:HlyD family secretion protein n=1 Tax=Pedobacter westerhofensis TaxID=425512 RepID=A0A521FSH0_9SPHI|nr:HlyD family secretion protein [Pedobacter westerhofensis]SMO99138.1 HlyD family secretion protein [Pedobacter westerhofensis]
MPEQLFIEDEQLHSDDISTIITAVPKKILRIGTTVVVAVLSIMVIMAANIQYPDIIRTSLKVNSLNSPKSVLSRQNAKLVRILVANNQTVAINQALAYLESTANHQDILSLLHSLKSLRLALNSGDKVSMKLPGNNLNLGEIQSSYQLFYQSYLEFISTTQGGHYVRQKQFLINDLKEIEKLKKNINQQRSLQEKEILNADEQYKAYSKLMEKGVISRGEFKNEQNKYFSSKYPLHQSDAALINNTSSYYAKQKEILDLDNIIIQEKAKFLQSLNALITEIDAWTLKYILIAPIAGKVAFAGIIQENQNLNTNDAIFIINPGNTDFFGEIQVPQYNMGKIHAGQRVVIKMQSYPYEQYGLVRGRVSDISDVAVKDSVFIAKISLDRYENKTQDRKIILKNGMLGEADVITEESSILSRLVNSFSRNLTQYE